MRASSYLYAADCYTAAVLVSSSIGGSRMFSVWFWSLWFLSFLLFFAATILASAALICFAVGRAVVPYFGLPPRGHQPPWWLWGGQQGCCALRPPTWTFAGHQPASYQTYGDVNTPLESP